MKCEPSVWLVVAQFGTPVILGIIGFLFTRKQIEISKNKLRLDHFDKRFAVFDAARKFLERATVQGQVSPQDENEFFAATRGATFLFKDQSVAAYIDELRSRMIDLSMGRKALEHPNPQLPEQTRKKYLEDQKWVRAQYVEIENIFRPHLQLND